MDLEIKVIKKNETWKLTTLPNGARNIGVKWIFKTKMNENGKVDKYKDRLVAKGGRIFLVVNLYVHDFISIGNDESLIERFNYSKTKV